jgi:two-component system response regulator HydG
MGNRILIIDDEEGIRFAFESFLSDAGYETATARDYYEALARMSEADFDVIFADIILGDRSGIDILRAVKESGLICPVIIITGSPDIDSAAEAVRLGAYDYIPKPIRGHTIVRVAQSALQFRVVTLEREKYRSNLDAIYRSVRDAIITVDNELTVIEVNDAVMNICGYSREVIGEKLNSLQSYCRDRCKEIIANAVTSGNPINNCVIECCHKDRPSQIVMLNTYPLSYQPGKIAGAVAVIRDETRLMALEQNLSDRKQMHNIVGKSEQMRRIYSLIESLADVPTAVLITGESGTGKELVAEAIHFKGCRCEKPLVKVNCAALTESLLESELFGHVKGAFTGAIRDKAGRFEKANGGTIFLDEIGDISPRMQLRLLGVLQKMEFERVGDSTPIRVDVRVVAATNADLREKVKLGEFRQDLYYRLKVVELKVPSLRERTEDIKPLTDHFINKFRTKLSKDITVVSNEVLRLFMNYSWPGNVRELEHVLEHAFIVSRRSMIVMEDLPQEFIKIDAETAAPAHEEEIGDPKIIIEALLKTAWNKAKAARLLGISRMTLYRKIREFDISQPMNRE